MGIQDFDGSQDWVIGHCRLAVHIRPRVSARVAQLQSDSATQIAPCPHFNSALCILHSSFKWWAEVVGYRMLLVQVQWSAWWPFASSRLSSMVEQPPHRMRG